MRYRQWPGLGILAALSFALGACAPTGGQPAAAPAKPAAPAASGASAPAASAPAATHPGLVELNEWSFLADSSEERTVTMAVDAFKRVNPNVRRLILVGDSQTAVTAVTLRDVWPKVLPEKGYEIVDTITFNFGTSDFSPIATRIRASGAEGIALSSLSPAAPNVLQELERQGTPP